MAQGHTLIWHKTSSVFLLSGVAISAEKASDFLDRSWKSRHTITRRTTVINAVEECCNEGCSLEEVSEYPCDL